MDRKKAERQIDRLMTKALEYAYFADYCLEYQDEPSVIGYNSKGHRLVRRAEYIQARVFGWPPIKWPFR